MSANKILMVGWELPPFNSGGLGEACWGLAKSLADKGYDITFLLPRRVNVKADFMKIKFADIKEADMLASSYTYSIAYSKKFKLNNPTHDFVRASLLFGERVAEMANKIDADLVHSHDWLAYPAGMAAQSVLGKPHVAHIHSTEIDRTGGLNPNKEVSIIEQAGLNAADKIISVSRYTKNMLTTHYGINSSKVNVIHNGVELSPKDLAPALVPMKDLGYKVVLFLGRITLMKGPEYFVRAARVVKHYFPKTLFIVAGSGDMQEFMMNEAIANGLMDSFIFTGFLRGEDKDRIFKAADVYVMPSVSEPFGITPLEAVANGTPVIISKQSGVSEVMNHALKVDFWDTDEMANKIVGVLRHYSLHDDLIAESSKELPNINWGVAADKCSSIYKELT